MKVSIRPDHCIALRLIAAQEHYRKSQDWLNMVPEWERLVEVASQSQEIIKMQAAEIEKLRAALKPFANLSSHWEGDKMPLEPKTIIIDPLPVLYAVKETRND